MTPLGRWPHFLGGTLFEIGAPVLLLVALWRQQQPYSASIMFYWVSESLYSVALYAKDARALKIELMGGDTHDWNWMLHNLSILKYDQWVGNFFMLLGILSAFSCIYFGIHYSKSRR